MRVLVYNVEHRFRGKIPLPEHQFWLKMPVRRKGYLYDGHLNLVKSCQWLELEQMMPSPLQLNRLPLPIETRLHFQGFISGCNGAETATNLPQFAGVSSAAPFRWFEHFLPVEPIFLDLIAIPLMINIAF